MYGSFEALQKNKSSLLQAPSLAFKPPASMLANNDYHIAFKRYHGVFLTKKQSLSFCERNFKAPLMHPSEHRVKAFKLTQPRKESPPKFPKPLDRSVRVSKSYVKNLDKLKSNEKSFTRKRKTKSALSKLKIFNVKRKTTKTPEKPLEIRGTNSPPRKVINLKRNLKRSSHNCSQESIYSGGSTPMLQSKIYKK